MPQALRNLHARLRIFLLAEYTPLSYFLTSRVGARPSEIDNRSLIGVYIPGISSASRSSGLELPPSARLEIWDADARRHLLTPLRVSRRRQAKKRRNRSSALDLKQSAYQSTIVWYLWTKLPP